MADEAGPPPRMKRYRVARAEKMAAMASLSWRDFFRDLGVRFLVVGAIVLVVLTTIFLIGQVVR